MMYCSFVPLSSHVCSLHITHQSSLEFTLLSASSFTLMCMCVCVAPFSCSLFPVLCVRVVPVPLYTFCDSIRLVCRPSGVSMCATLPHIKDIITVTAIRINVRVQIPTEIPQCCRRAAADRRPLRQQPKHQFRPPSVGECGVEKFQVSERVPFISVFGVCVCSVGCWGTHTTYSLLFIVCRTVSMFFDDD